MMNNKVTYIYAQLSFDCAENQWIVETIEDVEELEDAKEIAALNYCGSNGYRVIKIDEDPQGYNVYWLEKELKPEG